MEAAEKNAKSLKGVRGVNDPPEEMTPQSFPPKEEVTAPVRK